MYKIAICDDDKRYRKTIREIVEHENSLHENEVMIAICFWVCGFIVVTKGIAIAHIILMVSLITGK